MNADAPMRALSGLTALLLAACGSGSAESPLPPVTASAPTGQVFALTDVGDATTTLDSLAARTAC